VHSSTFDVFFSLRTAFLSRWGLGLLARGRRSTAGVGWSRGAAVRFGTSAGRLVRIRVCLCVSWRHRVGGSRAVVVLVDVERAVKIQGDFTGETVEQVGILIE
jgi:hypothetical protein